MSVPEVIVVGAGVSGCTCAAALANAGVRVLLLNGAMDRVCLPAYGPDLIDNAGESGRLERWIAELPSPLGEVWSGAALRPVDGGTVLNVDRRRVSVESKRLLEKTPGLRFRQGFVVDVRPSGEELRNGKDVHSGQKVHSADELRNGEHLRNSQDLHSREGRSGERPPRRVAVETAFGEVFEADAVVVAAGLSLGARSESGEESVEGGRYGEPASNGLLGGLVRLGVKFEETVLEVGPRVAATREPVRVADRAAGSEAGQTGRPIGDGGNECSERQKAAARPLIEAVLPIQGLVEDLVLVSGNPGRSAWPADYPSAPHMDPGLRARQMVLSVTGSEEREGLPGGGPTPLLSPDGGETVEFYVAAKGRSILQRLDEVSVGGQFVGTRVPTVIRALRAIGLTPRGRVASGENAVPIWITGRAGGASGYVGSLESGLRCAADIAKVLSGDAVP